MILFKYTILNSILYRTNALIIIFILFYVEACDDILKSWRICMKKFGDRLRDARERLDLKQTDVANATGINNKILSGYERNISQPSLENLKSLCDYYNISADEILEVHPKKVNDEGEEAIFLTKEQKRLLSYFNKLNQENKDAIIGLSIVYVRDQARKNTFQ